MVPLLPVFFFPQLPILTHTQKEPGKALLGYLFGKARRHCAQALGCTYLQVTQPSGIGVRRVSVCGTSHFYVG